MTTVAQAEASRTVAQAEASRVNGAKSRGPATAEGRERSRWNALRHGLAAEKVVVLGEEAEAFEEYRQAFYDDLQPAGAVEAALVERLAVLNWRLRRAVELETGLINIGRWRTHVKECEWLKRPHGVTDADWRPARQSTVGYVMEDELQGPNSKYDTAGRYERRLERGVFQTLRELRELRKERRGDAERGDAEKRRGEDIAPFSREPEASASSPAGAEFGDASMYGLSAPVGADLLPDPFARPDSGQAPPGKWKKTTWHYGPEYPGGCLVEERWVDKEDCGMRSSDCGLKTASSGNESSPAAEADNPKCEIRPASPEASPRQGNPQLIVPAAEVVAEGLLADEAVAPAEDAVATVTPQESPAQAQTSGGPNE
jgi:hypothetical protein